MNDYLSIEMLVAIAHAVIEFGRLLIVIITHRLYSSLVLAS